MYRVYHQVLTQVEDDVLRLVEVEKANYSEAADRLGMSADDIKLAVFLARQKLYFGMGRTLEELREEPAT
jgi:DNA-directed RNA polymerase specialized sigma24 family protein